MLLEQMPEEDIEVRGCRRRLAAEYCRRPVFCALVHGTSLDANLSLLALLRKLLFFIIMLLYVWYRFGNAREGRESLRLASWSFKLVCLGCSHGACLFEALKARYRLYHTAVERSEPRGTTFLWTYIVGFPCEFLCCRTPPPSLTLSIRHSLLLVRTDRVAMYQDKPVSSVPSVAYTPPQVIILLLIPGFLIVIFLFVTCLICPFCVSHCLARRCSCSSAVCVCVRVFVCVFEWVCLLGWVYVCALSVSVCVNVRLCLCAL